MRILLLLLVHLVVVENKCYENRWIDPFSQILFATLDDFQADIYYNSKYTPTPLPDNWIVVPDQLDGFFRMAFWFKWGTQYLQTMFSLYYTEGTISGNGNTNLIPGYKLAGDYPIQRDANGLFMPYADHENLGLFSRIAIQHVKCKYGVVSECQADNTHCRPPPAESKCYTNTWLDPNTNILYATLDDHDPQDESTTSVLSPKVMLYSNWKIVNEPGNNLSMSHFGNGWGNEGLIDINGRAFETIHFSTSSKRGQYYRTFEAPQRDGYTFFTNIPLVRIAIQHEPCIYGFGISTKCGMQDGQPSHCISPPFAINKCFSHTWFYKGILYATLDDYFFDTPIHIKNRGGNKSYIVPPLNWISKGNFTDMAINHRWGADYIADLDGNRYVTYIKYGVGGYLDGKTLILNDTQIVNGKTTTAYAPSATRTRIAIQHKPCPLGVSTICNQVEKTHCKPVQFKENRTLFGVTISLRSLTTSNVNNEGPTRPDFARQPLTTSLEPRTLLNWDQATFYENTCLLSQLGSCVFSISFENDLPGNVSWLLTLSLTRTLCSDRFTNTGSNDIRNYYVTSDKKWYFTMYVGECIILKSGTAVIASNRSVSKPSPCPLFGNYNLPSPMNIPSPTGFQFFYNLPFAEYWITSACNVYWASSIATAVFPNAGQCNYYSVGANISAWSLFLTSPGPIVVRKRSGCPILGSNQLLIAPDPFIPFIAVPSTLPDQFVVTFPRKLEDGIYINAKWTLVDNYKSLQPGPGLFLFRMSEQAETVKIFFQAEDVSNPIFIRRWMLGDPGAPLLVKQII